MDLITKDAFEGLDKDIAFALKNWQMVRGYASYNDDGRKQHKVWLYGYVANADLKYLAVDEIRVFTSYRYFEPIQTYNFKEKATEWAKEYPDRVIKYEDPVSGEILVRFSTEFTYKDHKEFYKVADFGKWVQLEEILDDSL